jgi:hypothetical protein
MKFEIEESVIEYVLISVVVLALLFGLYSCDDMQRRHEIEKLQIQRVSK